MLEFLRPEARRVTAYTLSEKPGSVRMHQNEGLPLPASVVARGLDLLSQALLHERPLNQYSNLVPERLLGAYARYLDVPLNCVEVTAGSSQGLALIAQACFAPGRRVALPEPSFSLYAGLVRLHGATAVDMPLNNRMQYARDSIFNEAVLSTHATLFCTPNNPTGSVLAEDLMLEFLEAYKGLVVVDEAYLEFAAPMGVTSMVRHIHKYPNLLVLRTLSKAWGAAGLRVGAMVANPELIGVFKALRSPYSIPFPSEVLGRYFLEDCRPLLDERVALTFAERTRLESRLAKIPDLELFPSAANFVFFRHPRAVEIENWLRTEHDMLVRVYDAPGLENYLRASLWTPEANTLFAQRLEEFLS